MKTMSSVCLPDNKFNAIALKMGRSIFEFYMLKAWLWLVLAGGVFYLGMVFKI